MMNQVTFGQGHITLLSMHLTQVMCNHDNTQQELLMILYNKVMDQTKIKILVM